VSARVDLFDSTYRHVSEAVLAAIRRETYGADIGQNSWTTADEYSRFFTWLGLAPGEPLLEVASGSGGPALFLARTHGCRVTGIDINEHAIAAANQAALSSHTVNAYFHRADAARRLPFEAESFAGLMCIDSINHFPGRQAVLREWQRVLQPGRRLVFTDPVVITGPVSNVELAAHSSTGFFLFVPPAVTERNFDDAGLRLLQREDVTDNAAQVSGRWRAAREARRDELIAFEGAQRFAGLQNFLLAVHQLTSERRLSRFAYLAEKPPASAKEA